MNIVKRYVNWWFCVTVARNYEEKPGLNLKEYSIVKFLNLVTVTEVTYTLCDEKSIVSLFGRGMCKKKGRYAFQLYIY